MLLASRSSSFAIGGTGGYHACALKQLDKPMKKLRIEIRALLVAIGATAIIMSCGPGAEVVGDAMVDAGMMLRDGGDAIVPDAEAQACGMNCTTSGIRRVLTADTDMAQIEGSFITLNSDSTRELVSGPFVLTDLSSDGVIELYLVPSTVDCDGVDFPDPPDGTDEGLLLEENDINRSGLRWTVRGGQKLCVDDRFGTGVSLVWSGFHPYE